MWSICVLDIDLAKPKRFLPHCTQNCFLENIASCIHLIKRVKETKFPYHGLTVSSQQRSWIKYPLEPKYHDPWISKSDKVFCISILLSSCNASFEDVKK